MKKLILPTLRTFVIGALALGLVIFLPAWTFNYWQAWVFIVVFMTVTNALGLFMALKDPALLERRKKAGPANEQNPAQKVIMLLTGIGVLALLVVPALDHRFGWSQTPAAVAWLGDALIVLAYVVYYFVFKVNSFGGSTIEVFEEHKVISSGPYALVRHPMYVGALIMCIGVTLALGSWWGLAVMAAVVPVLMWRILDEENLLKKDLPGYTEYTQKVHYRLVPYLW